MTINEAPEPEDRATDPAHTPDHGWGDEGGASHLGPATHIDAGHPEDDLEADEEQ